MDPTPKRLPAGDIERTCQSCGRKTRVRVHKSGDSDRPCAHCHKPFPRRLVFGEDVDTTEVKVGLRDRQAVADARYRRMLEEARRESSLPPPGWEVIDGKD